MSQRDLARALGVRNYTFVSQVETGHRALPWRLLPGWSTACGVNSRAAARALLRHYDPDLLDVI